MSAQVIPMFIEERVYEDHTERAMHSLIDVAGDFAKAVVDATSTSRCLQLRERLKAAIGMLEAVQSDAMRKADSF